MKAVRFQLKINNELNLVPNLTGNCPELGNWNPDKALRLVKEQRTVDGTKELWSLEILVPSQITEYKYFLGRAITSDDKSTPVEFFEPFVRKLATEHLALDEFGYYEGRFQIDKGCLENEFEYRLKILKPPSFISSAQAPWQNHIKCEVVFPESNLEHHNVFVSSLDGSIESSILPKDGIKCTFSDYITFSVRSSAKNNVFKINFIKTNSVIRNTAIFEDIGYAFVCLEWGKQGILTAGITSPEGFLIGTLSLDVLFIEPLPVIHNRELMLIKQSADGSKKPFLVGHRGSGATFRKGKGRSAHLENTMESFMNAYNGGITMVEFDVMLSKDKIPVIYHDYKTTLLHNVKGKNRKLELQVQDISYLDMVSNDFQLSKDDDMEVDPSLYGQDPDKRKLFPKLQDALLELPLDLGFNVEIKYCMELSSGVREDDVSHTEERNSYLNVILDVCLNFAGSRKLVFSSFDPDVCSMLKAKQSIYPVMFLTQGSSHYEEFMDQRTKSVERAINFARSERLFGIVAYSGSLLQDPSLIKMAKDKGLEVYCWGDQNNNLPNLNILKENLIDAIILDEIGLSKNFHV